jgi:hypothetical protein
VRFEREWVHFPYCGDDPLATLRQQSSASQKLPWTLMDRRLGIEEFGWWYTRASVDQSWVAVLCIH